MSINASPGPPPNTLFHKNDHVCDEGKKLFVYSVSKFRLFIGLPNVSVIAPAFSIKPG